MTMTHASLFSGIGGFDLAAEWAGWTNAFNCEIDPFCRRVLKYHFPDAEQYEDIRTADFTIWRDHIDVLSGGFPCQPFSLAGKRKGTEDDRYLWPEMLRVIRTVRPRWVVGENVFGIVNWSEGMVFDKVCSDLEATGYEVQPYIIPACGVGAPHRRDRCWFVAYRTDAGIETMREGQDGVHVVDIIADSENAGCWPGSSSGCEIRKRRVFQGEQERSSLGCAVDGFNRQRSVADAKCFGGREIHDQIQSEQPNGSGINCDGSERNASDTDCGRLSIAGETWGRQSGFKDGCIIPNWDDFPTQSPVCSRNDGFPGELAGLSFPAWRRESIKACGNAIVPQVALQIFETIKEYEKL